MQKYTLSLNAHQDILVKPQKMEYNCKNVHVELIVRESIPSNLSCARQGISRIKKAHFFVKNVQLDLSALLKEPSIQCPVHLAIYAIVKVSMLLEEPVPMVHFV